MFLDRLETLSAINFIEPAIPRKVETGKSCLFIRVEADRLILTGGNEFVVKRATLVRPNTTVEAADPVKVAEAPQTFMIPRADLLAFKEMMKEHKADCKKLSKNDPSYLFVEVDEKEMTSYDGKIVYQQPKFEFKDLEPFFDVSPAAVPYIPVMSGDISAAVFGFKKSKQINITFTGDKNPIHFEQGDFEAILVPPVEREEDGNEQTTFGEDVE